jgi:hypothetical protein
MSGMALVTAAAVVAASVVPVVVWVRRRQEDPLTKGHRAVRGIRRQSEWLKKPPFTDRR